MSKKLTAYILLLTVLVTATPLIAEQTFTFRVAEAPPRYFKDKNGQWTGLDVELGKALLLDAGITPEYRKVPWKRAMLELREGRLQFITNFSFTTERAEFIYYIGPERYTGRNLIVSRENKDIPIHNLNDFITVCKKSGIKFGFQEGVFYSREFNSKIEEDKEFRNCFESVTWPKQNIDKTLIGRIMGFPGHPLSMKYLISTHPEYNNLVVHDYVLHREPVFFGVSKAGVDADTMIKLYQSYAKLMQNGTFKRIREKWNDF